MNPSFGLLEIQVKCDQMLRVQGPHVHVAIS